VTDFPIVKVHVDELSSARIWQHKLCVILSKNVNINYRLPIKVYYSICTLRHIRIEIIHGSFHDLFLKYITVCNILVPLSYNIMWTKWKYYSTFPLEGEILSSFACPVRKNNLYFMLHTKMRLYLQQFLSLVNFGHIVVFITKSAPHDITNGG
jgi:hypothetical protein